MKPYSVATSKPFWHLL